MANYPKKMMDPTEAALSAIQEALNIRDEDEAVEPEAQPEPAARPEGMADLFAGDTRIGGPATAQPAYQEPYQEPADTGAIGTRDLGTHDLAAVSGRVANDDQQSIGQVLQALQQRPARSSYFVATVFSAAWLVGCVFLAWAFLPDLTAAMGNRSPAALVIGLFAIALLPVIFFFGVAHMAIRAQELRLIAQSMARVAMRLAEPEGVAQDSIVTVGQAIRREVVAMGDGVERALARASELEALVQSEVAALERTYSDNEVRIRGLLQELASQRDTLVGQAEQVRSAINNVQIDLTQDLSTISDLVGQQVNEAAMQITHSLAERGENITGQLSQIGDNMITQLSERGSELLDRLEAASQETSRAIAVASEHLTSNLNFKSTNIGEEFAEIASGIEDMMIERLDRVTEGFSEKSLAVVDLMIGRSQELTDAIIETSSQLAETIATRADEVNSTLKSSGDSLLLDLDLRGGEVAAKMKEVADNITESLVTRSDSIAESLIARSDSIVETLISRSDSVAETLAARSDSITETLVARSTSMTDSMRDTAEHVTGVLTTRSDAVKEMLTTRLAAFEDMFNNSGAELGERISRDSTTLGTLITRHLAEFDRTVKTYGSELVERLGARTQDVSESMRSYVDTFDNRVTAKANEVTTNLDQRLTRFQEAMDHRSQNLTDALSTRLVEITKTLNESGKEAVASLDKRISDVTTTIDARTVKLADTIGDRIASIDSTLGKGAIEVAHTLDTRVAHLEDLLGGRAEAIVSQMESRSRNVAEQLGARFEQIADSIKTNSADAERALVQLAANTTDALGKTAAASSAAAEALNRSAADATVSLNRSAGTLSNVIAKSAAAAHETIGKSTAGGADLITRSAAGGADLIAKSAAAANETIGKSSTGAAELLARSSQGAADVLTKSSQGAAELFVKNLQGVTDLIAKSSQGANDSITRSAADAERKLVGMSNEVSRNLAGMSNEVSRNLVGKAGEINAAVGQGVSEMTRVLDEKSSTLLTALTAKSQGLAGEVGRITDQTVKAIETKGFVFTQTMMDKSEEIARQINDASLNATAAVTRSLGQMQEGAHGVTEGARLTLTRTLEELHLATKTAIEQSKQTAAATVSEMMETHTMLRSDSTALFERLREANILLQEVLSGAQENMSSIEHTMAARISEFVAAMNDLTAKSGITTGKIETHLGTFNSVTARVLTDLGDLADQFTSHGRTLTDAAELLDASNRRTEESVTNRHATIDTLVAAIDTRTGDFSQRIDTLVAALDTRTEDFGQRLERFTGLLDESLDAATSRARDIAGVIAQTSNESLQSLEQQYELVRKSTDEERKRTSDAFSSVYDEALTEVQTVFNQSTERFTEVMQGMKLMAAEMQRELETTRVEMRRGILELPQETAESAAQMRRVIVDQIEALAELNRIVARHGRALDAVEPTRREAEPLYAAGGGRPAQARPIRPDVRPDVGPQMGPQQAPPQHQLPPPRDITGAPRRSGPPNLSPVQGGKDDSNARNNNGGGWLSDLLTRASREEGAQSGASREAPPPRDERPQRDPVDSIDSLSVDIARMIDHDAAAELWERYKRGERGAFSRRLYTPQGAKAFDEIRGKYRTDPEFRQTVEHYIHEFERLLDDVSRGDRGPAMARNYLTSDTGKVYTMLAHAAGRFD